MKLHETDAQAIEAILQELDKTVGQIQSSPSNGEVLSNANEALKNLTHLKEMLGIFEVAPSNSNSKTPF